MSFRRESYSIVRIGNLLEGSIKIDRIPILLTNHQIPVKYIKFYGIITDKTIDDTINSETGRPDYLLKLDDGTGSVWVRSSSSRCDQLNKWDFIRIIGFITIDIADSKDYEIMVSANAVLKTEDHNWELVHILESTRDKTLSKKDNESIKKTTRPSAINEEHQSSEEGGLSTLEDKESSEDESALETLAQKIERILRENDAGNGVEFTVIMSNVDSANESEVDDILFELAYEGKVYQPRPDYYRIMD